jgi:hypothetical protein
MVCGIHLRGFSGALRMGRTAHRTTDPTLRQREEILVRGIDAKAYGDEIWARWTAPPPAPRAERSGPCRYCGQPTVGLALAETRWEPLCEACLDRIEARYGTSGDGPFSDLMGNILAAREAAEIRRQPRAYGQMTVREAGRLRGLESRGGRFQAGSPEHLIWQLLTERHEARRAELLAGLGGEDLSDQEQTA